MGGRGDWRTSRVPGSGMCPVAPVARGVPPPNPKSPQSGPWSPSLATTVLPCDWSSRPPKASSFTAVQGGMQGAQGGPQLSSELVPPPSCVPPFLLLLLGLEVHRLSGACGDAPHRHPVGGMENGAMRWTRRTAAWRGRGLNGHCRQRAGMLAASPSILGNPSPKTKSDVPAAPGPHGGGVEARRAGGPGPGHRARPALAAGRARR